MMRANAEVFRAKLVTATVVRRDAASRDERDLQRELRTPPRAEARIARPVQRASAIDAARSLRARSAPCSTGSERDAAHGQRALLASLGPAVSRGVSNSVPRRSRSPWTLPRTASVTMSARLPAVCGARSSTRCSSRFASPFQHLPSGRCASRGRDNSRAAPMPIACARLHAHGARTSRAVGGPRSLLSAAGSALAPDHAQRPDPDSEISDGASASLSLGFDRDPVTSRRDTSAPKSERRDTNRLLTARSLRQSHRRVKVSKNRLWSSTRKVVPDAVQRSKMPGVLVGHVTVDRSVEGPVCSTRSETRSIRVLIEASSQRAPVMRSVVLCIPIAVPMRPWPTALVST